MVLLVLLASVGCVLAIPLDVQVQVTVDDIYEENAAINPEELSGFFEGDIELLPGENPLHRNAINDRDRAWPGGVVPYEMGDEHTERSKLIFLEAMQEIMNVTSVNGNQCITYKPRNGEAGYVKFSTGTGCHTPVGYTSKLSAVTLGTGCVRKGIVMHELLHALGFWHEQSRTDRDEYVTINWDNIQSGHTGNFNKYPSSYIDMLDQPYDYGSIMHYNAYAFAVDTDVMTIDPVQSGVSIGQRRALSPVDIREIQILYNCETGAAIPATAAPTTAAPTTTPVPYTAAEICTFEEDMCQWTQSEEDTLNWHRHNGGTPVANTGPDSDHTGSETAYYIFIKAKNHHNKTALLESGDYPGGDYCVDFYYHMYGSGMDSFRLNVVAAGTVYLLKTWSHNHGNIWTHQLMNAHIHTSGTFKFQFEGHIGDDNLGDIALDDIAIFLGDC